MVIPYTNDNLELLKERTNAQTGRTGISKSKSEFAHEILGLCRTLDYSVTRVFTQRLKKPDPKYFIGTGKAEEITQSLAEYAQLEFAVFDCSLKPSQVFNLETKLGLRVIDRSTLILMIFLHHARTREAKLQVEYAIIKHQLPYVKELVRRSKMGEHPGYMAGGEYKVDEYYRLANTRIRTIQLDLRKIKTSRGQQRKHRRGQGFLLISVAGYTNAGKSSILKVLTDARVLVDDRMFSTVSPKTRRFRNSKILLTDTVGFIQNIPTQLIEAFKSTLEEIIDADQIMLIVDISEPPEMIKRKLITCFNTINQLIIERFEPPKSRVNGVKTMILKRPQYYIVFNKSDLEPNGKAKVSRILAEQADELSDQNLLSVFQVSCKTKDGIKQIIERLSALAPGMSE